MSFWSSTRAQATGLVPRRLQIICVFKPEDAWGIMRWVLLFTMFKQCSINAKSCFSQPIQCSYTTGHLSVGEGSCGRIDACKNTSGTLLIGSHACLGPAACSSVSGNTTILDRSCSNEKACFGVSGETFISAGKWSCLKLSTCYDTHSLFVLRCMQRNICVWIRNWSFEHIE